MSARSKYRFVNAHSYQALLVRVAAMVALALCAVAMAGCSQAKSAAGTPSAGPKASEAHASATKHSASSPIATKTPKPPTATATPKPPTSTPTPKPPTATPTPKGYTFSKGTQLVGSDIQATTYRTRSASKGCYWERLSGLGGTLAEIIANDNTDGPAVVTIGAADKAFSSERCASWTQDLSPITKSPDAAFPGDGTFIVGVDIAAGTWRNDGSAQCYWARLAGFSGTLDDIIANDNPAGTAIVTIAATDKGFISNRCGTWTKVE